ncbi:putative transcriptional regulator [Paraburkholderia lycopersici]|uniref:Putative transcriptional regulator n=2 Tax=Paraburkholderia lycopersici TaxID=416944 RepID=A0A1G6ZXJ1_9BURK|nr:helix-turn-helix domain-containing protein [Paraburkholderia lycopersici]SDE07394.1 putative transcriptional regulator [Paraburkholderia lycopersici]
MNDEMERFRIDLLRAVREMEKRGTASGGARLGYAARRAHPMPTAAALARARTGLSQSAFAALLGVSTRTLQDWEQGRRQPTGAAQTLLRVAVAHPEALRDVQGA